MKKRQEPPQAAPSPDRHKPASRRHSRFRRPAPPVFRVPVHGSAYVDVRARPGVNNAKSVIYDVRIRTAPVNAMVNAIMRLGLFRGHVIGQIEDTMKDLVAAAVALSAQGVDAVLSDPSFTPDERVKVQALAALPD